MLIPDKQVLKPAQEKIQATVEELKSIMKSSGTDEGIVRNVKRRLSKYTKVATVMVGGPTQGEAQETKDRVDDAVCAISSAINGGIIPGAGSVLYTAARKLSNNLEKEDSDESFKAGAETLLATCRYPIKTILNNAGFNANLFDLDSLGENETIDIIRGEKVDAYDSGIIDPVMASRNAIINAISIAKTFLNSSSFIIEEDERQV
jgi:chaperonin GroEL